MAATFTMPTTGTTTPTQTFDPKYINSYGELVSGATNPNLATNLSKYGTVTDAYGNPIFDQNTLSSYYSDPSTIDKSTKKISDVAGKTITSTLGTWADEVLQKDTLDPLTGKPVNWVGGTSGKQYQAARAALIADPTNNARWTAQKTQAQKIADEAVATAKTEADAKIAADAKAKADADAATANDKAAKEAAATDLANQQALETANALKLKNATAPLDAKTLGGGFDANGNPINSTVTSGITQDVIDKGMLNVAKVGAPTTIVNPNSAADVAKMVDAAKASEVNVTPDSMVSNQLSGLLAKNNPYIQQAVNAANLQASRRGMLNTGAAAGFAQDAAIKAALPIAQQDALTRQKANEANAQAANQLLTTSLGLKATSMDRQAQNDIQVQNWNAANKIAVDTSNTQAINTATNLFTTAMLNNLNDLSKSNVENAHQLNQLITSGNITIAQKASEAVIAQLASQQTFENNQKLEVFKSNLKINEDKLNNDALAIRDQLKYDNESISAADLAVRTIDLKLMEALDALNRTPDITAEAQAAKMENLRMIASAQKKNIYKTTYDRLSLTNSEAGKTATALVSPLK